MPLTHKFLETIKEYEDTVIALKEWYESWKRPQFTKSGDNIAKFVVQEMEKRFPILTKEADGQ